MLLKSNSVLSLLKRNSQVIKFLAVGVLNTLFGYGMFNLFLFLGFHYVMAVLLGTILGVLFNFKTIGTFVFGSKNNRLIFRFVMVYVVIYLLNILFLYIFTLLNFDVRIAGAILLVPMAVVSFGLNKFFVFEGRV